MWTFADIVRYGADDANLRVAFCSAHQVIEPARRDDGITVVNDDVLPTRLLDAKVDSFGKAEVVGKTDIKQRVLFLSFGFQPSTYLWLRAVINDDYFEGNRSPRLVDALNTCLGIFKCVIDWNDDTDAAEAIIAGHMLLCDCPLSWQRWTADVVGGADVKRRFL